MSPLDELLRRHQPLLRFDSSERSYADSAAVMTDGPGHLLRRADGTVLAAADPVEGQQQLSLAFLGASRYADGTQVRADDELSIPDRDYDARAETLHHWGQRGDRAYGHAAVGSDGQTWLQYWFFYLYNDYQLLTHRLRAGLHEGDWESVQLRLGSGDGPDLAVYAQHRGAAQRPWAQVERVGQRPVVYVARGSHASYFGRGLLGYAPTGVWIDRANGRGRRADQALEVVHDGDAAFDFLRWPGRWGDTHRSGRRGPLGQLDADSPVGPGAHAQWRDPALLLAKAEAS